jgi:hypothetical protein
MKRIGQSLGAMILRAAIISCCGLACTPAFAGDWTPDPSLPNPALRENLYKIGRDYGDANFDPKVNMIHQKPRDHVIVQSANYAYGLFMTGDPADLARVEAILRNIIASQDTRPGSKTRGAWLWRLEDKWQDVKGPIDANSACFVGADLEGILMIDAGRPRLDPALRAKVEQTTKIAVQAVMDRNVDPGYSNIALLSACVTAGAAKLWDYPGAAKFADGKLSTILALDNDSSIYEYNAPTYLAVDLGAAYGCRRAAFSDAFAAKANAMIDSLWKQIALSYDGPTYNLVGPNNRSYGENMLNYSAGLKYWLYLALGGKYPIENLGDTQAWDRLGLMALANTPVEVRPEFQAAVPAWREVTVTGPNDGAHPTRHLFEYRDGNFAMGTVELQDEWKQKRNLTAYWRTDTDEAPDHFRIGFCLEESNETLPHGFPYARMMFHCKQVNGAALVALSTNTAIPSTGSNCLVFTKDAQFIAGADGSPNRIVDGSETAYLYPVANGSAMYQGTVSGDYLKVTRDWTSADKIGDMHIISYAVIFRPTGSQAPKVTGLALLKDGAQAIAKANVDGDDMSLSFKN